MQAIRTKSTIISLAMGLIAWTGALTGNAEASDLAWHPENNEELNFKVLRQGKPFGYHKVTFGLEGETITVKNDIELEVKIGPFRAFYYRHESDESWDGQNLISMDGTTRKDGKDVTMTARRDGDVLRISGTNYSGDAPAAIIPSSHWNKAEVQSDTILSSEGGELLDISVEFLGRETIEAQGQMVQADRYRLTSELTVDLWYDEDGRWVKCAFEARGQSVEYVLE